MSTKKVNDMGDKPLPKWFDGTIYNKGSEVENRLGYGSIWLEPNELAMYDLIMGVQMMSGLGFEVDFDMNKALSWFRSANPKAYMVLLD